MRYRIVNETKGRMRIHMYAGSISREQEEILRELRFLRWDKKSSDDLRRYQEENKELSRIAEEIKGMPVNTDMEKLAYLKKEQEFFEKTRLYRDRQQRREKKTNMLYEKIDGDGE